MTYDIAAGLKLPAKSVHDVLSDQAEARPEAIALEFGEREVTYAEAAELSRRFGSALARLGIERGDRVGIALPNQPEFLFAYYGALMAGANAVLYNVMLTPSEIEYQTRDSGAKVIVVLDELLDTLKAGVQGVKTFERAIVIGDAPEGELSLAKILAEGDPDFTPVPCEGEDLVQLIYTSGTTGKPKGAMISHFNLLSMMASIHEMQPDEPAQKTLCVLPLFHAFGLVGLLNMSIMRGGTLLLQPRFEAGAVVDALKNGGVTAFAGTPTMYFQILNHPEARDAQFPALSRCGCGGAPMPIEVRAEFRERFGIDISEGYGLSESTVGLSGYPEGLPIKSGSVGVPNPGVEMKVVGEDGVELLFGEVGEILARGPNIMVGYWNKPEETAKTLRDGWLHTGDLGYCDRHGYFHIVDRKKDMIIKGGFNIYPREIEEVIYELREVSMAAVVGVPDAEKGEIVQAVVVLKHAMELTPEAIQKHLAEKLAKYKLPQSISIVRGLPTGPTGKILKRELRSRWDEIAEQGARWSP